MILVQMYNIFRLLIGVPDYSISSESYGGKQKHVENDGHLNKQLYIIYNVYRGILINSYNLYTICNKMSNDISTDVQYI